MKLALFDLDNTLLACDSDYEWAQYLIGIGILDRTEHEARNLAFYEDYKAGTLDIYAFLDFQLAALARYPRSQLDAWHAEFMRERILPAITEPARSLVAEHRHAGHECVIITATNAFVTAPIAREFGIDHLIATEVEETTGGFTGRPSGLPSFREGKVTRLEQWLTPRGGWSTVTESWFYSDSANDLPLLERVIHPIAVDPDPRLHATAEARGWPIMHLHRTE
jgi:HAD superfamily hydrolase (TIGR01490 family)